MTKFIVRYGNRKLYSKDLSRYIKLGEIAQFVKEGDDVLVLCNRTKNDITDLVLSQAVLQKGITRQTAISLLRDMQ